MNEHEFTLSIRARAMLEGPLESAPSPAPLVIAMHGYAESGEAMREFTRRAAGSGRVIACPNAPFQFYRNLAPGQSGTLAFSWLTRHDRAGGVAANRDYLDQLVAFAIQRYAVDPKRITLLGYSQSASLTYTLGFTAPYRYAGAVVLAGGVFPDYSRHLVQADAGPRAMLVAHGREDTWVPLAKSEESVHWLTQRGKAVTWSALPGGHERTDAMADVTRHWLDHHDL